MITSDLKSLIRPGMGFKLVEDDLYDTIDPWNGRLLIWETPQMGNNYALGIDPSSGVGADRSVIEVIRLGDLKRPSEQVAEFASDFHGPFDLSPVIDIIGRFYSGEDSTEALASIECNTDSGDACQLDLRTRLEYSNLYIWKVYDRRTNMYTNKFGWYTTRSTRPKIIDRGMHDLVRGDLIVNSPYLLDEMEDFQRDHFAGRAQARHGTHDDRVMALLIGYWCGHEEEWIAGDDLSEQRRLLTDAQEVRYDLQAKSGQPTLKADWHNTAVSAQRMAEESDELLFGEAR